MLSEYKWEGIDQTGMRIKGITQAANYEILLLDLKKQKITPLQIKKSFSFLKLSKKIKIQELTDFTRQLANLLNTNIPLTLALTILQQNSENTRLCQIIAKLIRQVESGQSFSFALTQFPEVFSSLYCQLVIVGEQTARLSSLLEQMATHQEKITALTKKIHKALFYPLIVTGIAAGVVAILLVFVVPQFSKLFADFGAQLPFYTRFVLDLAANSKYLLGILLFSIAILVSLFQLSKKNQKLLIFRDTLILKLPWFGSIIQHNILARFCQTLAISLDAALPLTDALQIIAKTCNNSLYTKAVLQIYTHLIKGQTISNSIKNVGIFPKRLSQIITVAEEAGTLKIALQNATLYHEQQVDDAVTKLTQLLEPAIMLILGLVIGGLITAIYLPIFKLGNVI